MSTIEEAREQARVVKESVDARLSAIRLGKSIMRASDKDILALRQAQDALATLLDATEPPAPDFASLIESIKQTGGSVEIAGVKITPCDEYGRAANEPDKPAEVRSTDTTEGES